MREIREVEGVTPARFRDEIVPAARPVVLRGLARDWPVVRASEPLAYLRSLATPFRAEMLVGQPGIGGRFFYDAAMDGFNFTREPTNLASGIDRLAALADDADAPAVAVQSVPIPEALPGFAEANRTDLVDPARAPPRLWLGNRVVTALHFDVMSNLAVVIAGRRRFTLIPPDQAANLYVGPIEFTPAATPVSLVDPEAPDLARFPLSAAALSTAEAAELGPGDAIHIPYMWWHQVRSLDPISALVNHWWSPPAPLPGLGPVDALVHARLAFGDQPPELRAAWRALFDTLVFGPDPEHIPTNRRGIRGPLDDAARDRLRRQLGALMAQPLRPPST